MNFQAQWNKLQVLRHEHAIEHVLKLTCVMIMELNMQAKKPLLQVI